MAQKHPVAVLLNLQVRGILDPILPYIFPFWKSNKSQSPLTGQGFESFNNFPFCRQATFFCHLRSWVICCMSRIWDWARFLEAVTFSVVPNWWEHWVFMQVKHVCRQDPWHWNEYCPMLEAFHLIFQYHGFQTKQVLFDMFSLDPPHSHRSLFCICIYRFVSKELQHLYIETNRLVCTHLVWTTGVLREFGFSSIISPLAKMTSLWDLNFLR